MFGVWKKQQMSDTKTSIIVVGGGTAGWMAASYLSVHGYQVTLIESHRVPIVGVGESTLPALNYFCQQLGLAESEWMSQCSAVYKLGINHRGWNSSKSNFWHYFIYNRHQQENQHQHIKNNTLPNIDLLEYAYHVDASEIGHSIARPIAFKHGCQHLIEHVSQVLVDDNGISGIVTESGKTISADYYIDCTGWAKLLAKPVGIKYSQYSQFLNNRAIACPQPPEATPNRYTITYRKSAGWMWEIALTHRRGSGYVYSSEHMTDEQAVTEFCQQFPLTDVSKINFLKFTPEKCINPLHKNVVAVGLSAGFIEPLEATGLFFIQYLIEGFHKTVSGNKNPEVFNRAQSKLMDEVYDYILCHYTLSGNTDSEYWRYYNDLETKLNTKKIAMTRAAAPDTNKWTGSSLFSPYSWWALLDGYGLTND